MLLCRQASCQHAALVRPWTLHVQGVRALCQTFCSYLKASLKRLDVEYVDLVFCHRPDVTTPIEETVRAMNFVIDQGWAFYCELPITTAPLL